MIPRFWNVLMRCGEPKPSLESPPPIIARRFKAETPSFAEVFKGRSREENALDSRPRNALDSQMGLLEGLKVKNS
jgi:hypothetical protein